MDAKVQAHMKVYHQARHMALTQSTVETSWPLSYMNKLPPHDQGTTDTAVVVPVGHEVLKADYAAHVQSCSVTVVFLDPRLADPHYGMGQAAWFALESAAAFLPYETTCFALLTNDCAMETYLQKADLSSQLQTTADQAVRDKVYAAALPLFRHRIDAGRVRLSYIDPDKYHLKSCSDFGNPTSALVNYHFWQDEFVPADSDAVLLLQDDAVLCRNFNPTVWYRKTKNGDKEEEEAHDYAFVGAVWPRTATQYLPNPPEGMCWGIPSLWKLLTLHMKVPEDYTRLGISPQFSHPCPLTKDGSAPVGNGGFSWRSRRWMQKAIATCPHVQWSGLPLPSTPSSCRALDEINEDYYFATVLRGLQAPLPTAQVASLFAVESIFADEAISLYGTSTNEEEDGEKDEPTTLEAYRVPLENEASSGATCIVVPTGFHKPWWYHSNELLLSPSMRQACPYLPFIFTPDMSRVE